MKERSDPQKQSNYLVISDESISRKNSLGRVDAAWFFRYTAGLCGGTGHALDELLGVCLGTWIKPSVHVCTCTGWGPSERMEGFSVYVYTGG